MRIALAFLTLVSVAAVGEARPVRAWTYQELVKESDLVVIATPISSRDLNGEVEVPNVMQRDAAGTLKPVMAVGVETKFEVQVVLKGEKQDLKDFVVYYLREPDKQPAAPNGPMFATFNLKQPTRYLLFLKRDADGRYVSTTGQTDSAIGVKDLQGSP